MGLFKKLFKENKTSSAVISQSPLRQELRRESDALQVKLKRQDAQLAAIHSAEEKYSQDKNIEALISFWQSIWENGELLFNGVKWTFRLPDLYIRTKQYDEALKILTSIKNPNYTQKKQAYINKIELLKSRGNAKSSMVKEQRDLGSSTCEMHNALKSANGLYPHEILMLSYYKKYVNGTTPARFWQYNYNVDNVPALLRKLETLGFADGADLTEKGSAELASNEYVVYMHRNKYLDITMPEMSILVNSNPQISYRDLIWGELNNRLLQYTKQKRWGYYRNTRYSMYRFLMEENRCIDAFAALCSVASQDINAATLHSVEMETVLPKSIVEEFHSIIIKLDINEASFIEQMEKCYDVPLNAKFDKHTTARVAAAIIYGHADDISF